MIPQAESDAGLLAYEQVQAFASLRRKKLPLIYLFPLCSSIWPGWSMRCWPRPDGFARGLSPSTFGTGGVCALANRVWLVHAS